jgi:hypothetical protein
MLIAVLIRLSRLSVLALVHISSVLTYSLRPCLNIVIRAVSS